MKAFTILFSTFSAIVTSTVTNMQRRRHFRPNSKEALLRAASFYGGKQFLCGVCRHGGSQRRMRGAQEWQFHRYATSADRIDLRQLAREFA